jgi:anti-anti-sigma factor
VRHPSHPPSDLAVRLDERKNGLVIVLTGQAGMREAEELHLVLTRVLATRPKLSVIDCTGLTLLASVAMGALLAYRGGVKLHGGSVKLVAAGNVRDSLRRARIDQVIDLADSVDAAMA